MRSGHSALLPGLLLGLSTGCLSIEGPRDFLLVHEGTDELRLVTPEEAALWVREFSDEDQGDLDFWSAAVRADFVQNRGYVPLEMRRFKDGTGQPGREWLFEVTTRGQTYRYLIALLVFEGVFSNTIRVSEYVAPGDRFDTHLEDVRRAVTTVR